jgi:very-short-patch-repair endonuclease
VPADPSDPYTPVADLGYRDLRIAIQYDGRHHRTAEQQAADVYRDDRFRELGWTVVRLTWLDQRQGFARLIRTVREGIAAGR